MSRVLVVDDDQHICTLIKLYLIKEGLNVSVARDGEEAIQRLSDEKIDLAIIDVMMPKLNGIELVKAIRLYNDMPILLVTAKGESADKVIGFEAGTDDYLVKPFDPIELVLRVKSLLKRNHLSDDQIYKVNGITLDYNRLTVINEQHQATLKKKEMELLFELLHASGRILTRQQLVDKVWGYDYQGDERTVDVHIKRLREKCVNFPSLNIVTVRGLGYRLEVENHE